MSTRKDSEPATAPVHREHLVAAKECYLYRRLGFAFTRAGSRAGDAACDPSSAVRDSSADVRLRALSKPTSFTQLLNLLRKLFAE